MPRRHPRRSSLISSTFPSPSSISLLLLLLGSAAPTSASRGDTRRARRTLSDRQLQPKTEPLIVKRDAAKRDVVGARKRGIAPISPFDFFDVFPSFNGNSNNNNNGMDTFNPFDQNSNGNGNANGNGNGNGNKDNPTTVKTTSSTKKTTAAAQTSNAALFPSNSAANNNNNNAGTNNGQQNGATQTGSGNPSPSDTSNPTMATGTEPPSNDANPPPQQTHSFSTQPGAAASIPHGNDPYYDPTDTVTMSVGSSGNASGSQSGATKGLVIGLVVSLIILVAVCGLGTYLVVRRMRKRRRELDASPFNDTAPWIGESKQALTAEAEHNEKAEEAREGSIISHMSQGPSIISEARMRARTPGGSSAVPVPYDPSEISDDVSAHFTFFPQDENVGVPVPYPLALHIPARVAKAMAERDARWQQFEVLQRQGHLNRRSTSTSAHTQDELMTIPDRGSRRSTRRSTTTDSIFSSNDGVYYAIAPRLSSVQSQSEVGLNNGHTGDTHSVHGSENGESLMSPVSITIPDFPNPPPAAAISRIHSQSRRLQRASGSASYSPRLLSVSENPFATNADMEDSENRHSTSETETENSSDEATARPFGPRSRPLSALSTVDVEDKVTLRASPAAMTVLHHPDLRNPFEDPTYPEHGSYAAGGDDRRVSSATELGSIRDSEIYAGVVQHQTVDGHESAVFAFPAPPDPHRRPSASSS